MPDSATKDTTHRIVVCTTCKRASGACPPGSALIGRLKVAMRLATDAGFAHRPFEVSGIACMAGCSRPCTVAYQADGKASYLFGDVDPAVDIDALVAFAKQYGNTADGWTKATERPDALSGKTLARIPGSLIVTQLADGTRS